MKNDKKDNEKMMATTLTMVMIGSTALGSTAVLQQMVLAKKWKVRKA